jgi:hypothetical protein
LQSGSSEPPQPRLLFTFHTFAITLLLEAPQTPRKLVSADESGIVAIWEADTGLCLANTAIPAFTGAQCVLSASMAAGRHLHASQSTASMITLCEADQLILAVY